MSLLMFSIEPHAICVITDTQATRPDGVPGLLVTKCGIVPHLEMAITGTGSADLADRWREKVLSRMLCYDIDMLDQHTPNELRTLKRNLEDEYGDVMRKGTSTIYHFGFSEAHDQYAGYAYRSTNDFMSESLQAGGFALKPPPETELSEIPSFPDEWIALAEVIRAEDNAKAIEARLGIGGELVGVVLTQRRIVTWKVHRFADFEDLWSGMNTVRETGRSSGGQPSVI
jgi:hypothetical protein